MSTLVGEGTAAGSEVIIKVVEALFLGWAGLDWTDPCKPHRATFYSAPETL